ncbi:histidine phosphatase family protein [Alkalihalobacillus sp. AL-G]|nr:histidine phosphatase family protein [Alkalihalobacillus sp. AL-G]WLD95342.1 histidine phosphatase family protein [Alkalihalobacillus sp. AL-G]
MTEIYMVRHAHSVYTQNEYGRGLSEQGKKAAKNLTEILRNENIDFILSSPYRRAVETVKGIATHIGKTVQLVDGFKERTLAEKPVENFNDAIDKLWSEPAFSFPGGESNEVAQARGVTSLRKVLKQHEDKRVVVGTHGNIMVLMMNYFNPNFDRTFWNQLEMPDVYKLTFVKENLIDVQHIKLHKEVAE